MKIEKRVLNWKYFIGWKLFMYISFLLVYFNCFYFVQQYTILNNEVDMLKQEVYVVNQLVETAKNEPEKPTSLDENKQLYGIVKTVDQFTVGIDYVQLLDGIESKLANQEDGKCDDELSNCFEDFYIRNNAETVNNFMMDESTSYSLLLLDPEMENRQVNRVEFIDGFQNSDRKDFFVVSLIINNDPITGDNMIKEIHQIYTP